MSMLLRLRRPRFRTPGSPMAGYETRLLLSEISIVIHASWVRATGSHPSIRLGTVSPPRRW